MVCLLVGGPVLVIEVNGECIRFEDHPRLGPMPVNHRGEERSLGPRHRFWEAATAWYEGGKQTALDGRCMWAEPPEPSVPGRMVHTGMEFERLAGRHWVAIGAAQPVTPTADHPRRSKRRRDHAERAAKKGAA